MKYAIVETGGKQYKAVEGETIDVDRLPDETGKQIFLEDVLLLVDNEEVKIGTPILAGEKVKATILNHFKGDKIVVFRYRPKKRIRVKKGHRQHYTRLMIDQVTKSGKVEKQVLVEEGFEIAEAEVKVEKVGMAVETSMETANVEVGKKTSKPVKAAFAKKPVKAETKKTLAKTAKSEADQKKMKSSKTRVEKSSKPSKTTKISSASKTSPATKITKKTKTTKKK